MQKKLKVYTKKLTVTLWRNANKSLINLDKQIFINIIKKIIMKKITFLIMASVIAVIMASCGFKSTEQPLWGSLVTYTAPGDAEEIFTGVRDVVSGKTLIQPGNYIRVAADDYLIICQRPNGKFLISDHKGKSIAPMEFESFSSGFAEGFYIGGTGKEVYYCFRKGLEYYIPCKKSYMTEKCIFVEYPTEWSIVNYQGGEVGKMSKGSWLVKVKSDENDSHYIFTPGKGKSPDCTVYDVNGKIVKKLSASSWRLLLKKLEKTKKALGSVTYAEIDDIKKI